MKMKYIPNAITISRIIMVAALIFLTPFSTLSFIIFLVAGFTDMIDGTIARNIKDARSNLGAELDSMADMFMVIVSIFAIMPAMSTWPILWHMIIVALIFKLMSAVPGIIKHRKVFFLHTISNKVLALILFTIVPLYYVFGPHLAVNIYIVFAIVAIFIITFEEMVIISTLDYPHKDIRGFWQVKMINKKYRESNRQIKEI